MDYVNFTVTVPVLEYLWLEKFSKKSHASKNEIILSQIIRLKTLKGSGFNRQKNAGFKPLYNETIR